MENKIYYDVFANNYVTEKDKYAAPERYYEICKSKKPNTIIEIWRVDCKSKPITEIPIEYGIKDKNSNIVNHMRNIIEIANNLKLLYLKIYMIPEENYNEIYNHLYKKENTKITNYPDMTKDTSLKEVNFNRLDEFLTWEYDWNGYGSPKIDKNDIEYARELITLIDEELQPEIFPTQDSKFQFEWESVSSKFYFEMEILGNDNFNIYFSLKDGLEPERDRFEIHIDKENLNDFIKLIVNNRLEKRLIINKHNIAFCPKCGLELDESFNYCYNCGQPLKKVKKMEEDK